MWNTRLDEKNYEALSESVNQKGVNDSTCREECLYDDIDVNLTTT